MKSPRFALSGLLLAIVSTAALPVFGQDSAAIPARLSVEPGALAMAVGESVQLEVVVRDAAGNTIEAPVLFLPVWGQFWNLEQRTWGFNLFRVSATGVVTASKPGVYAVIVRVPVGEGEEFLQQQIPLRIRRPPVTTVELVAPPSRFYADTSFRLATRKLDAAGMLRDDVSAGYTSSDPAVATVDRHGDVLMLSPGTVTLTVSAGEASASIEAHVEPNRTRRLKLVASAERVRTGDVVQLKATATDEEDAVIEAAPVAFSIASEVGPWAVGGPSSGLIDPDGRFVAEVPGRYTVTAISGTLSVRATIEVVPREVQRRIELVGHGRVRDRGTSDLWVWEAPDGRDYAITGTHSAEGHAYIWDVTDPSHLVMVDSVRVDARTVNDVKVSEDGRIAVISREGASSRRNGIVILDVSSPADGARVLARYDDELTGGVHNLFIRDQHVYALSAGQRFDILNIEDPTNPRRVGRFELPNPDRSIHDVWVVDGIAYSANWNDGVVMVDVGGGNAGGSPREPVLMGKAPFPSGWNHAVHPYRSLSTGKHYVFAGDEAARSGRFSPVPEVGSGTPGYEGDPARWRGWIHVFEWEPTPGSEPKLVARYAVPEAGSHNIWVENDVMYVAFYNGGLRVVDVSGELMGDLYRQGREIAYFLPFDPQGFQPNSPQVWGAQPHKGHVFFSDYNSGLWAVRLSDPVAGGGAAGTDQGSLPR